MISVFLYLVSCDQATQNEVLFHKGDGGDGCEVGWVRRRNIVPRSFLMYLIFIFICKY